MVESINLIKATRPATLGTIAKKLVIEVGAPSYTSESTYGMGLRKF